MVEWLVQSPEGFWFEPLLPGFSDFFTQSQRLRVERLIGESKLPAGIRFIQVCSGCFNFREVKK